MANWSHATDIEERVVLRRKRAGDDRQHDHYDRSRFQTLPIPWYVARLTRPKRRQSWASSMTFRLYAAKRQARTRCRGLLSVWLIGTPGCGIAASADEANRGEAQAEHAGEGEHDHSERGVHWPARLPDAGHAVFGLGLWDGQKAKTSAAGRQKVDLTLGNLAGLSLSHLYLLRLILPRLIQNVKPW